MTAQPAKLSPVGTPIQRKLESIRTQLRSGKRVIKRWSRLARSDVVVVSHPKSGRTWLAAMISHVYHQLHGVPAQTLIRYDNFHRLQPEIPRIFFHDDHPLPGGRRMVPPSFYKRKKVILLLRDPRDVAVSWYFQLRRNKADEGRIEPRSLFRFVVESLPLIMTFFRHWQRDVGLMQDCLVVRYEDLRGATDHELSRIMGFIGADCAPETIRRAVEFAAFDNLQSKERQGFFEGDRLRPGSAGDPKSFKVRRGKVGGYQDEFTAEQLARINALVDDPATARFGYQTGG
ncbi:MAG: sulfotransferase domain-containing protein [Pseudomonadota bacterium]